MARRTFRSRSYGGNSNFRRSFARKSSGSNFSKYIHQATALMGVEEQHNQLSVSDLPVHALLKQNILKRGFTHLTAIQEQAIAPILTQKDVIGIAQTGTGKTGAFLIPLLHMIAEDQSKKALIVVPTRELAQQIREEMVSFSQGMGIYAATIIGGSSFYDQIRELRRNPHIVIGTPGRIADLIERKLLDLSTFNTVVLDEVDRMLDMGFIRDIRYLISLLPKQKQSLFFSATLSPSIKSLIYQIAPEPVMISVQSEHKTANIEQNIVRVAAGQDKMEVLHDLLIKDDLQKILIFGRTKRGVERLSVNLLKRGFKVASIHGDKPQAKRNTAIRLFKNNIVNIMIATDVASRGIDIDDITHVINYDEPENYDDYIHRIGRTGRANKKGTALTFID